MGCLSLIFFLAVAIGIGWGSQSTGAFFAAFVFFVVCLSASNN